MENSESGVKLKNIQGEDKLFWADNLRVIATISVIFLHVAATVLYKYNSTYTPKSHWWIGNIIDGSVRFCVPIFVMLTGVLLLSKEHTLGTFLKKRLLRVILPFVFWSIVYILYNWRLQYLYEHKKTLSETAYWIFLQIKNGSSYHLWYVYMIIGIYLFIPIIGKWVRSCTEKEILYFLFIWLITLFFSFPIIAKYKLNIDLTYFTGYLGYLILGYYFSIKSFFDDKKKANIISILLIALGIGITILGTYFDSVYKGSYSNTFYQYLTPNVLMASIGVFVFFQNQKLANITIIKIRDFINKYSYGIYLIHVLILILLDKIGINWFLINPAIGIPTTTIVCLVISAVCIYIINKLPFGKYISG